MKFIYSLLSIFVFLFVSCADKTNAESINLYIKANDLYSSGKFNETVALLNNEANFPPSLTLRAKAEYFLNDLDKAEKSCRQAIKARPTAFEAKLFLARVLREKGETEKVKQLIDNMMSDNPKDINLLRLAASNALDKGDLAGAFAFLDSAVDYSSESALVLIDRARLHWIAGNAENALEDLSRARAMLPWNTYIVKAINQLEKRILEEKQ